MHSKDFWVYKCHLLQSCWVVYRECGKEILVEMSHGKIIYMQEELTAPELDWIRKNINQII